MSGRVICVVHTRLVYSNPHVSALSALQMNYLGDYELVVHTRQHKTDTITEESIRLGIARLFFRRAFRRRLNDRAMS